VLALIYLQAWSMLLCMHIYIRMLWGVNTAYGVKGCVSNTVCVITVMYVVMWFYANTWKAAASVQNFCMSGERLQVMYPGQLYRPALSPL